jgi:hypothetical protein
MSSHTPAPPVTVEPPNRSRDSSQNSPQLRRSQRTRNPPRSRENRNYTDPEELRRIVQSLEEQAAETERVRQLERAESDRIHSQEISELRKTLTQFMDSVSSQIKPRPEEHEPPRPSIEHSETSPLSESEHQRMSHPVTVRYVSESPRPRKTQLTEKLVPLDDGTSPTFRQWEASIRDRLEVNADYYSTERSKKALVWGTTINLAREYLEPEYLSGSDGFQTAEDMIQLLASLFLTGNEVALARDQFHHLTMETTESFTEFKARFLSKAIRGKVYKSEWPFYLWNKITPFLRNATLSVKMQWDNDFQKMTTHLTSVDIERQRCRQLNPSSITPNPIASTKKFAVRSSTFSSGNATYKGQNTTRNPPAKPQSVVLYKSPGIIDRTTPAPTKSRETPETDRACYKCGKLGHFKDQCPLNLSIQELAEADSIREDDESDEFQPASEVFQEENVEA